MSALSASPVRAAKNKGKYMNRLTHKKENQAKRAHRVRALLPELLTGRV
jgi:hypothetical protein